MTWALTVLMAGCGTASDDADGGAGGADSGAGADAGDACLDANPNASAECAACMCEVCREEVIACDEACWLAVECARPCVVLENLAQEISCIQEMCPDYVGAFLTDPVAPLDRCTLAMAADGELRACAAECEDG